MKIVRYTALMMIGTLLLTTPTLAAQFNFTPFMTVSEEYNDNIFLTPDNEEDDFITTASLGFTAELLGRTSGAELTYIPSYEWFADFSENDGWAHDATARVWYNFAANTSIELRNAFLRTRDPLGDSLATTSDDPLVAPDIEADQNRRGREEYYTNATTLRLDHQFGAEDTVYAAFRYRILRNVGDDTDDNDIWEPSIGGTYWFTNFWGMESDFIYSNRDYEVDDDREEWFGRLRMNRRIDRHLNVYAQYAHTILNYTEGASVDYEVYEPTVGFNYQLDENTRIDIGVGWYFQNLDQGDDEDGFLLTALADKVWPFRRGLVGVTLLAGTEIDDAGVEDLGFSQYYEARARTEYAFTPRFSGNANIGYRRTDYPDNTPDLTEDEAFAGAGLEYQALRWMFLNLDYSFRDFSSDDDADEYTENRVIFSITLRPDQPFRLMR